MISRNEYLELDKKISPKSKEGKTLLIAFFVGGLICMIGQAISDLFLIVFPDIEEKILGEITSTAMIFLGALLTGFGLYDRIGKYAGAGSIVPITGFANSVVSPAMEYRSEGMVFGVMCKMFVIAGPIIVSGIASSIFVGLVYWLVGIL